MTARSRAGHCLVRAKLPDSARLQQSRKRRWRPRGWLVQGSDGNLYGVTATGGLYGQGTVFKITLGGMLTTLYSFCGPHNCPDGAAPTGTLVLATDGNFYGTTSQGGANSFGSVFKIAPDGTLTTLYSFLGTDGANPHAGLIQATDGNFYGTTLQGGANSYGAVFKITPSGVKSTVYDFCALANCADGRTLYSGVVQGSDGNFYGTTFEGGANAFGTVYKLTPAGTLTTLYSFCPLTNCPDGGDPWAGLVQGSDGNFYGTTLVGGTNGGVDNGGVVFKITPSGALTTSTLTLESENEMGLLNGQRAAPFRLRSSSRNRP